jgi:hypothetical protein
VPGGKSLYGKRVQSDQLSIAYSGQPRSKSGKRRKGMQQWDGDPGHRRALAPVPQE